MSITEWAGRLNSIPPYKRDEAEPYSLSIVLRVEKGILTPTHEEALITLAEAIAHLFNDERTIDDTHWVETLNKWTEGRIRKITRRARGKDWLNAKIAPHSFYHAKTFGEKTVEVLIFAPHPAQEVPHYLRKLQVAGLDLEQRSLDTPVPDHALRVAFNPDIKMTTGKAMAQIGHAVQLTILDSSPQLLTEWVEAGMPIALTLWEEITSPIVAVQDAGFTEVPPGTVTVKTSF